MADERSILRVGLTGNIGAGKSTVAAMLGEHGCLIVDADRIARGLLQEDAELVAAIAGAFGEGVLNADGGVDRAALARIVFRDTDSRRRLERLTHPRIRAREEAEIAAWKVDRGIAVTEAALLVETGGAERYDRLLVVVCDDDRRLARLLERGMDPEDARRRMQAQLPQRTKAAAADHVIDNSGSIERTRARVDEVFAALERDLAAA